MIYIAFLIYYCFLFLLSLSGTVILTLLVHFLFKKRGRRLSRIGIFLAGVSSFIVCFLLLGFWVYGNHFAGFPGEKENFEVRAQQHLKEKYPQFQYKLEEAEFACPGFFEFCSNRWVLHGKLIKPEKIEFEVLGGKDFDSKPLSDDLGYKLSERAFERDRPRWVKLVRKTLNLPEDQMVIDVGWKYWGSTDELDCKDEGLKVNIDIIKKLDSSTISAEEKRLFRLKQVLQKHGIKSLDFSVSYFDPSVKKVIQKEDQLQPPYEDSNIPGYITHIVNELAVEKKWKGPKDVSIQMRD